MAQLRKKQQRKSSVAFNTMLIRSRLIRPIWCGNYSDHSLNIVDQNFALFRIELYLVRIFLVAKSVPLTFVSLVTKPGVWAKFALRSGTRRGTDLLHTLTHFLAHSIHCTALILTTLHCTALQCTSLHCIALHCIALQCTVCTYLCFT